METKTQYAIRVAELAAIIAQRGATPRAAANHAVGLIHLGTVAARNALRLCNVPNAKDRRESIKKKANAAVRDLGWTAKVSGDPRGYCLHLFGSGLYPNTLGGEEDGYGV